MSSDTPTPREYKDADGKPISLMALVVHEPEWATSQILHRDKLERELAEARKELAEYRAATDPHYVDELAALKAENARMREVAEEMFSALIITTMRLRVIGLEEHRHCIEPAEIALDAYEKAVNKEDAK